MQGERSTRHRKGRWPQPAPRAAQLARLAPLLLMPVLLMLSVLVLLVAPRGTTTSLLPIVGTAALAIEFLYLAWLVLRLYLALAPRQFADPRALVFQPARRCLFSAINALFGLLVFTMLFYPLSHQVVEAARASGAARLLWTLTIGGAVVTLAFGQLVALLLDVVAGSGPMIAPAPKKASD